MPTSSDAWFDIKAQMNDEASATPIEVQALKDFLSGKISASIAAKQIMMMNDDDPFPFQDKLYRVSLLIFDAAMRFQAQQPSLMELLDALNQFSEHDINLTPWQKAQYPHWATCTFRDSFVEVMDPNQRGKNPDPSDKNSPHDIESIKRTGQSVLLRARRTKIPAIATADGQPSTLFRLTSSSTTRARCKDSDIV